MDLDLSGDQELLRDATARFIDDVCPLPTLRAEAERETGLPADYLRRGAELGWFAMLAGEEYGGGSVSDAGLLDAAVLAEVRGASVQPGPFIPMNVVAYALDRGGSKQHRSDVLPAVIAGEHVTTWALSDPGSAWRGPEAVTATATTGGHTLNGCKPFVQDARVADSFLLDALIDGRPRQVLVHARSPGVEVSPLESLDVSMRMSRLRLEQVFVSADDLLGTPESGQADLEAQLDVALVLVTAETVGAMDRLFALTVGYARDRIAFGRPIGSFQAVKHQLADLSLRLEMSKGIADAAALAVAGGIASGASGASGAASGSSVASVAKAFVGEAAIAISQGCFQVHGGIGFTWEHDLHLYLRRASVNNVLYGTPSWHRERILRLAGL